MANKFQDGGCSEFHVKAVRAHRNNYHEGDLDKAQPTSSYLRAARTDETNRSRLLHLLSTTRTRRTFSCIAKA